MRKVIENWLGPTLAVIAVISGVSAAYHVFATNETVVNGDSGLDKKIDTVNESIIGLVGKLNEKIELVDERITRKELKERLNAVEERIWWYDGKYGENCEQCNDEAKKIYLRLLQERRDLMDQLFGETEDAVS